MCVLSPSPRSDYRSNPRDYPVSKNQVGGAAVSSTGFRSSFCFHKAYYFGSWGLAEATNPSSGGVFRRSYLTSRPDGLKRSDQPMLWHRSPRLLNYQTRSAHYLQKEVEWLSCQISAYKDVHNFGVIKRQRYNRTSVFPISAVPMIVVSRKTSVVLRFCIRHGQLRFWDAVSVFINFCCFFLWLPLM